MNIEPKNIIGTVAAVNDHCNVSLDKIFLWVTASAATFPKPPTLNTPTAITSSAPPIRITPWIKSVHITPSIPPRNEYITQSIPIAPHTRYGLIVDTEVIATVGR